MSYVTFQIFCHSVVTCLSPVGPHELWHLPFTPVTLTIAVFHPQQCCQPDYSDPLLPALKLIHQHHVTSNMRGTLRNYEGVVSTSFACGCLMKWSIITVSLVICHASPKNP